MSNLGDVRRDAPGGRAEVGRELKGWVDPKGYRRVLLTSPGRSEHWLLHRLVCTSFHGNPPEGKNLVLHWDDDPGNNRADNLRWGNYQDNADDRKRLGTSKVRNKNSFKTHCPKGHEYSDSNTRRDKIGRRTCRECRRERYHVTTKTPLPELDPRHGTSNGYLNFRCRCKPCREAYSDYHRRRRQQ